MADAVAIDWLLQNGDYNPQLIGTITGAVSVNIEIWEFSNGSNNLVPLSSSGCYQISNTGRWGFSVSGIPESSRNKNQFFYRMVGDNGSTFAGQMVLEFPEDRWKYPSINSDYLVE